MKQSDAYKRKVEDEYVLYEREDFVTDEDSESFADYIRRKRKEVYNASGDKILSIGEHARRLGLSQEMYRKILNLQKPNQSRDCIIAICATLEMDSEDTNKALHLYGGMPGLDERSPRDSIIINIFNRVFDNLNSIEIIDNCLTRNGFSPLSIIDHRKKAGQKANFSPTSYPYKMLKKTVKASTDSLIYGDRSNSLATEFDFSRYRCYANMWLDDPENKREYKLQAEPGGGYLLEIIPWPQPPEKPFISFTSIEETGDFSDCFVELQGIAKKEQRRLEGFLNDTKNYRERIGAGIHNHRIHVFYETYNYDVPELNEYYLFEYIDDTYRLTVSKHSLFMQRYLLPEIYEAHYGCPIDDELRHYDSLEEIESLLSTAKLSSDQDILTLRRNAYKKLKPKVDECLCQLRNRERFVFNLDEIWDDADRVCEYYHVEAEYQCEIVGEYHDTMIARKKEASFTLSDNTTVLLSLEDLYRAYELGFMSIEEICWVKANNGSIEAVLK